jgi:hypothetical protein
MASVIVRNNPIVDEAVIPPLREDGRGYRYCMYFNSDAQAVFADSHEELLTVLIPGYPQLDELDADVARIKLAQAVAAQIQAELLTTVDPSTVSEKEWAILNAPRSMKQPEAGWWTCEVPLVAVETAYAPYTDVPRPTSGLSDGIDDAPNLWWIRPTEDEDFLFSLHEVGYIRLMENTIVDQD